MPKFKGQWVGRERLMRRLSQLVPEAEKQLADAQLQAGEDLAEKIQSRAPVGVSGEYKASIHAERLADSAGTRRVGGKIKDTTAGKAIIKTKDKNAVGIYAGFIWRFLEFGTRAHTIKAKNGPLLVFKGKDGNNIAVPSVQHPGMPRQPHVFPTYRAEKKKIRRKMAAAVNKAVRKIKSGGGVGALPAELPQDGA